MTVLILLRQSNPACREASREDSRPHRIGVAQSAGIDSAELADHGRYLGWSGIAGRHAFARHWAAADGVAAADEIGIVRYGGGHLAARCPGHEPRRRAQRAGSGREPDPGRGGTVSNREAGERERGVSGYSLRDRIAL